MDGWICTTVHSLYKPLMEMRKMAIEFFDHQIKLESFLYSSEHNLLYCRIAKVKSFGMGHTLGTGITTALNNNVRITN